MLSTEKVNIHYAGGKVWEEEANIEKLKKELEGALSRELPEKYRYIIYTSPNMSIKELLKIAVEDQYISSGVSCRAVGEDEKNSYFTYEIGASAQDKIDLLKACFHTKYLDNKKESDAYERSMNKILQSRMRNRQDILKEQKGAKLTKAQKEMTTSKITLSTLGETANAATTFELTASSEEKIEARKKSMEELIAEEKRLLGRSTDIQQTLEDCEQKLSTLKTKANEALNHQKMDTEAATEAVDIYANAYLGKIKPDSDKQEKAVHALEKKLQAAGIKLEEEEV